MLPAHNCARGHLFRQIGYFSCQHSCMQHTHRCLLLLIRGGHAHLCTSRAALCTHLRELGKAADIWDEQHAWKCMLEHLCSMWKW